jgi:hypothetical protein
MKDRPHPSGSNSDRASCHPSMPTSIPLVQHPSLQLHQDYHWWNGVYGNGTWTSEESISTWSLEIAVITTKNYKQDAETTFEFFTFLLSVSPLNLKVSLLSSSPALNVEVSLLATEGLP